MEIPSTSASAAETTNAQSSSTSTTNNYRLLVKKAATFTPYRQSKIEEFFQVNSNNPNIFASDEWKVLLVKWFKDKRIKRGHLNSWLQYHPWIMANVNKILNSRREEDLEVTSEMDGNENPVHPPTPHPFSDRDASRRVRFTSLGPNADVDSSDTESNTTLALLHTSPVGNRPNNVRTSNLIVLEPDELSLGSQDQSTLPVRTFRFPNIAQSTQSAVAEPVHVRNDFYSSALYHTQKLIELFHSKDRQNPCIQSLIDIYKNIQSCNLHEFLESVAPEQRRLHERGVTEPGNLHNPRTLTNPEIGNGGRENSSEDKDNAHSTRNGNNGAAVDLLLGII